LFKRKINKMSVQYNGKYTQAFLSDAKIKKDSIENKLLDELIKIEEDEVVWIYSLKGNKLLFAKGFEILNLKDEDITSNYLNSMFTQYFQEFINEYNDRILLFLYTNTIEYFSSSVIIKIKEIETSAILNIKIYQTDNNGNIISFIGRSKIDNDLKTTDIVQYSFQGDVENEFLEEINQNLNFNNCISLENIKLIEFLEKKKENSEISNLLNIPIEKINQNLLRLYKRFNLKDENELVKFGKDNYLIPNQFDKYQNK
jgi:hypothetical protein